MTSETTQPARKIICGDLTAERERELIAAWQTNRDDAARADLIASHDRLLDFWVEQFACDLFPADKLRDRVEAGLMHAVERHDIKRQGRLWGFAVWWIFAQVTSATRARPVNIASHFSSGAAA
jgi:DNA-directed RNA polymerase sigma subunit (sigma70/sigma32)